MPPPTRILRLLAFVVPAALTLAGVQPILGAASGSVTPGWALQLAGPAIAAALVLYLAARRFDRGDMVQPPWYAAWLLFPGAFLLAAAASAVIFGALGEFPILPPTLLGMLSVGTVATRSAHAPAGPPPA